MLILALACAAVPTSGSVAERTFAHQEAAFAHLRAGRHCEAVAELDAAYALDGQPGHLLNRAMAVALWPGHCTQALAAFDAFLVAVPQGPDADEARAKKTEILNTCPEAQPPILTTAPETMPPDDAPIAPWIAGGVAVLGAAAGGTFFAFAADDRDAVERWQSRALAERTERYRGREDDARAAFDRHQTAAWIGLGVAGAALSTALTLLWFEK